MVIPTFSPDLTNARSEARYPYLEILDRTESIALVISSLEQGELPVVFSRETDKIQIASIKMSAKPIRVLLKVTRVLVHTDAETSIALSDTASIMQVLATMKGS